MTEYPITTEQIQLIIYVAIYAISAYIFGFICKIIIAKIERVEKKREVKTNLFSSIKNWWVNRKYRMLN